VPATNLSPVSNLTYGNLSPIEGEIDEFLDISLYDNNETLRVTLRDDNETLRVSSKIATPLDPLT